MDIAFPDNKTTNEVDHLFVSDLKIIENYEVLNRFTFLSDHRAARANVGLALDFKNTRDQKQGEQRKV